MNKTLKGKIIGKYGSQVEFAKAIGEHEAVISRVVRGHHDLTAEERMKWAEVLDYDDPERLFQKENN
jgi:plasmid maintenance system antidote protein VapI